MSRWPEHIAGTTTHARRGGIRNAFRYGVDYVLIDPDARRGPLLFSRNRLNLASVHDRAHGGPIGQGRGADWAREVLAGAGFEITGDRRLLLLTQPRFLGLVFNPVSFWLAMEGDSLRAVIAEVSTPFHDRHSYLCHKPGFAPITRTDRIETPKYLHVSPYQQVAGSYAFHFDIRDARIAIRIFHANGPQGVIATLFGPRRPLTNRAILTAYLRRPFGAMRTLALIYWQALVLKLKGAPYRRRPEPPAKEIT
ncbi:DUF1365 domain-containing protein [Psychromarinibacter sp. C21-152]|uniref:DUF1365 domain-containing protein n=1 Tax=Psychromarinibacter sediminicola TaxID=3033385 RepID=A0AAE3T8C1_9RHOB|nr:DUF1365 domain-containing protein [Psychromarinibacter sediminicola]MDF0601117.1 DUF1365 domain-containing protein [Psychromarinibacter sediminicola]